MLPAAIKGILPTAVKYPLLTYVRWYRQMRGLPAQSSRDISIFKEVLSKVEGKRLRLFEWGSGASTIYYPEFLRSIGRQFDWYAMDNSREWCQRGREKIARAYLTEQAHIYCSEFPAFWKLPSYSHDNPVPPQFYANSARVMEYINCPKDLGGRFEVMIVDGRFRRRCLLVAAQVLASKGIVILHDAHRTHYHSSLSLYPHIQFLETGVVPGTRQRSSIALCSIDGGSLIFELAEKYRGLWHPAR